MHEIGKMVIVFDTSRNVLFRFAGIFKISQVG